MLSLRSIVVGLLVVLAAYKFAPSPTRPSLLPVQKGDAIVVTGCDTGIGKHAALTLAKEGFTVFAGVLKLEDGGKELLKSAQHFDIDAAHVKPILLDVTNPEQIAEAVKTVAAFVGDRGLYGLFNNAGIGGAEDDSNSQFRSTSVEYLPIETYRKVFEVNFFGMLQVIKAFLPLIRLGRGCIVNNTSSQGFLAMSFISAYASSKFAAEALSDSLRRELDPHGVRVSVLEAGMIMTPVFDFDLPEPAEQEGMIYAEAERSWWKTFFKNAMNAPSPKDTTSKAVVHAMRAPTPQTRYIVGKMGMFSRLIANLPDTWADSILRSPSSSGTSSSSGEEIITDEELVQLRKDANAEFDL